MANTTNFGWETPDDTDLVKDGAAAIRTLGSSIDTSFVDLKGGTTGQILSKASNTDLDYTWINNDQGDITAVTAGTGISGGGTSGAVTITNSMATAIDAKGDLIAGTGADTFDRLAVGSNGTVLTADSSTATGLKWASPTTTETWSLLNAGGTNLTGATTVTVSGISNVSRILVIVQEASTANASAQVRIQINGDTAGNYSQWGTSIVKSSTYSANSYYGDWAPNDTGFILGTMNGDQTGKLSGSVLLTNCNSTSYKISQVIGGAEGNGNGGHLKFWQGFYSGTSAVSSISVTSTSGNLDGGKVYIYAA